MSRTSALVSASSVSHAARMSANSVSPPRSGMARASKSENFAGTGLYELSECHRRLPSWNRRWRSSRGSGLPSRSRFDTSLISAGMRPSCTLSPGTLKNGSSSPNSRVNAICCSFVMSWPRNTRTPNDRSPARCARDPAGRSGWRRSIPVTTPAKSGRAAIGRAQRSSPCCSSLQVTQAQPRDDLHELGEPRLLVRDLDGHGLSPSPSSIAFSMLVCASVVRIGGLRRRSVNTRTRCDWSSRFSQMRDEATVAGGRDEADVEAVVGLRPGVEVAAGKRAASSPRR